jgi:DNA-binding CsgD family transcriptional regulator
MTDRNRAYDTHSELIVQPYKLGIRIVRPHSDDHSLLSQFSISSLFSLPASVYFLDFESRINDSNSHCIETLGAGSIVEVRNKRAEHFFSKEVTHQVQSNDDAIMRSGRVKAIAEPAKRLDGASFGSLAIKFPWYFKDKVVGIFGFSFIMPESTCDTFGSIINQFLLNFFSDSFNAQSMSLLTNFGAGVADLLTTRQHEVMSYLIQGRTAKQIGKKLSISPKTVEHHTARIKNALNCDHKTDIIDKIF